MSVDVQAALRLQRAIQGMLDDPDLTGDVLLLATTMAVLLTERRRKRRDLKPWTVAVGEAVGRDWQWVWMTVRRDVPRYQPPRSASWACDAPMIRREGPCGRSGSNVLSDRDPETGEITTIRRCGRHVKAEWPRVRQHHRDWEANGKPTPPPNTGGVLARHFDGNWDAMYAWADPARAQPVEDAPPPRPKLTLIHGGAAHPTPPEETP